MSAVIRLVKSVLYADYQAADPSFPSPHDPRPQEIYKKILSDPLLKGCILASTLIATHAIIHFYKQKIPSGLQKNFVKASAAAVFLYVWLGRGAVIREVKMLDRLSLHEKWWTRVADYIFAGAIPIHELGHIEKFKQKGISAIVSIVDKSDFEPGLFVTPVRPDQWRENQIDHYQIPPDNLNVFTLKKVVDFLHHQAKKGKTSYVHSYGGTKWSGIVAACYLLTRPEDNEDFLYKYRTSYAIIDLYFKIYFHEDWARDKYAKKCDALESDDALQGWGI